MKAEKASGDAVERSDATPMRSPVNWALLGLVIERPSYAYDLAQRFERRYGEVLPLSNIGHIYTALGVLGGRALVEEIPGTRAGRQPKPHYCATPMGVLGISRLADRPGGRGPPPQPDVRACARRLDERAGAAARSHRGLRAGLPREGMHTPITGAPEQRHRDSALALLGRLSEEENRLAVGAKLDWVEYARQELKKLDGRGAR